MQQCGNAAEIAQRKALSEGHYICQTRKSLPPAISLCAPRSDDGRTAAGNYTGDASSRYLQNAFASCICRGVLHSASNNSGGKPRRRRFILQGTSRHSDGCRCTRIPFREVRRRGWTSSSRGRSAFRCQPTLKATAACAWPRCCGRKRCALPLRASRHVPRRRRAAHGAMSF